MNLAKRTILLISPESWGHVHVSKHHYAMELAGKGNEVYYLNPPVNKNKIAHISANLYQLDYKPRFRGLSRLPSPLSAFLTKLEVERLEKLIGQKFDIIWNFDSSRFFNIKLLHDKLKIAHLVDYYENLNRDLLCKTSDLCLCTSDFIGGEMKKYNANVHNIGHGYRPTKSTLSDSELNELNGATYKIRACYIGNLNIKYLDWDSILKIIKSNPEVGFYFIGPEGKSNVSRSDAVDPLMLETKKRANTFFLGSKSPEKVLAYLEKMDALLLIYKADKYKEQLSNPHKVLEYLGSGKVVVSSWTEEYRGKKHLLEMTENNLNLPIKFSEIVSRLNFHNSPEKQSERKAFALNNTYEKKILQIEDLIEKYVRK